MIIYFENNYESSFYKENIAYFNVALGVSRSIKIAVDLFFHFKFFQLFKYLVKTSDLKSKEQGAITKFQLFIKFSIVFLFCMSLL